MSASQIMEKVKAAAPVVGMATFEDDEDDDTDPDEDQKVVTGKKLTPQQKAAFTNTQESKHET